jgi:hypothetical protein
MYLFKDAIRVNPYKFNLLLKESQGILTTNREVYCDNEGQWYDWYLIKEGCTSDKFAQEYLVPSFTKR